MPDNRATNPLSQGRQSKRPDASASSAGTSRRAAFGVESGESRDTKKKGYARATPEPVGAPPLRDGLSVRSTLQRVRKEDDAGAPPERIVPRAQAGRAKPKSSEPKEKIGLFVFGQGLSFDYGVLLCTIGLTVLGLLMVLSASSYKEGISGDSLAEFRSQLTWAVIGIAGMLFFMNIDYRILKMKGIVYAGVGVTLALLLMVWGLPKVGIKGPPIWSPYVNYAYRWLRIGTSTGFLSVQPSEIAKITLVIFLAWFFDKQYGKMHDIKKTIGPALLVTGSFAALIILQPNLSTTGAILITTLIIMYVAGSKWWVNLALIGGGVVLIVVLLQLMPDRMVRYTSFRNPWADAKGDGWQLIQSLFALANGGWFGTGPGMSRQKHLFLPYSSSDFIFAIAGEELGFVGAVLIMLGFLLLVFFGVRVALNAKDRFGCYLAAGISALLAVQVVINIAVVTGSMPTTGLPLPFFTAGGTTLMIFLCSMGMLLSVSRKENELIWRSKKRKKPKAGASSA